MVPRATTVGQVPMVAAAVCPHPPMLIPQVAAGAAAELDDLRAACHAAIDDLVRSGARTIAVVGSHPAAGARTPDGAGSDDGGLPSPMVRQEPVVASFADFGVPLQITLAGAVAVAPARLPLSLSVAAWLLRGVRARVVMGSVRTDLTPVDCAAWRPPELRSDDPWALLAMGDGSARRGERAPGYHHPHAEDFDKNVAAALAAADAAALLALDPALAAELWCAGRAPWQVLAGLAAANNQPWRGRLFYDDAPYGVAYFAASWNPAPSRATGPGRS